MPKTITNRRDLAKLVAYQTGMTLPAATEAVSATLVAISNSLVVAGDTVRLRGFGCFDVRVRKPRTYRDPTNHERKVSRPAVSVIHFKASDNDPNR